MSDLHISWDEYRSKTEDLAKQILSLEHKHYPTVIKEILNVKS